MILQTLQQLTGYKFTPEHRFYDKRKWRFDFAHIESKTAIEIEGGAFTQGRHTRGKGFVNDMEKYNQAALLGWTVLRFTPEQMQKSATFEVVKSVVENRLR